MTTSFARALSPIIAGHAAATEASFDAARNARHTVLQGANSLEELIAMVPHDYREVMRPHLIKVAALATKRVAARSTLTKWEMHAAREPVTFPNHISTKVPEIQLTKEFSEEPDARATRKALDDAHTAYCVALLKSSILVKKQDVEHLDGLLEPGKLYAMMKSDIDLRVNVLTKSSRIPVFSDAPAKDGEDVEMGELKLVGWEDSPTQAELARSVRNDAVVYAFRAISIVEVHDLSLQHKLERKKAISKSADVEMADATKAGPSIQSLVDRAVNARLKQSGPSKVSSDHKSLPTTYLPPAAFDQRQARGEKGEQRPGVASRPRVASTTPRSRFTQADQISAEGSQQGRRQDPQGRRQTGSSSRGSQDGHQSRQRTPRGRTQSSFQEAQAAARLGFEEIDPLPMEGTHYFMASNLNATFRYDVPSSYPDWLLTVPHPIAVNYVILNTPVNVLLASQFKSYVHCSPGVTIPREIEYQLSVGMRYMLHSPRNTKLINESYKDFERRVRWRLAFAFTGEEESEYDPDYEVDTDKKDIVPPKLPPYIEMGLKRGRDFVLSTIRNIPAEEPERVFKSLIPSFHSIKTFLDSNDYIVTNTDKNLGLAVSKRQWINSKCQDLLDDPSNYMLLHPVTRHNILKRQCLAALSVAALAKDNLSNGEQISKYLRSKVTPHRATKDGDIVITEQHTVPQFYGIPKIHKQPVKMRPIIPCHSAIQNPAAKYCSKKLKPMVTSAPTIIHGTKDLAIKLSKLVIDRSRKWYIVTGDVVAYYPNIPIKHCLDVVSHLYCEFYRNGRTPNQCTEVENQEDEIFHMCLQLGNTNLVTQFEDKFYEQIKGLAMGVADSPDLANLYGWYFERTCGILNNVSVPFYGRYIDDCFGIVYAPSEQDAVATMSCIKFDGCVIEWGAAKAMPFLDMLLYQDENNRLQHMPYRKAGSHQERVPWISHHPLDVKRGTFIGEMSRLATLSSQFLHYKDAMISLAALYIARGYPSDLVYKWLRDHITERWNKRLNVEKRVHDEVLVLKTEFNTAWNYFSAKELGDTVLGYWRDWTVRAASNEFTPLYPKFSHHIGDLRNVDQSLTTEVVCNNGTRDYLAAIPDIRKINILNRRMITSRKRTRNLFDLTSLWKKTVLQKYEADVLDEDRNDSPTSPDNESDWDSDIERLHEDDLEFIRPLPDLDYTMHN
jgi:hypothetical protein